MSPAPHIRRYSTFISYRHADNTQEGRRWVRKELGRSDRILAIIIAGEPDADAPASSNCHA